MRIDVFYKGERKKRGSPKTLETVFGSFSAELSDDAYRALNSIPGNPMSGYFCEISERLAVLQMFRFDMEDNEVHVRLTDIKPAEEDGQEAM